MLGYRSLISISLLILLAVNSPLTHRNVVASSSTSSAPPWREVEMCNHAEDGKTLSLYNDVKLHGTSTLMLVAELPAGSCDRVRVLEGGSYFTGSRDEKSGRIVLHSVVRLPATIPVAEVEAEAKEEDDESVIESTNQETVLEPEPVFTPKKQSPLAPQPVKMTETKKKGKGNRSSNRKGSDRSVKEMLKPLTIGEGKQRDRIRTKIWNTNDVTVHILLMQGEDDGVSELAAEPFATIGPGQEAYFVFPANRTVLATREDEPEVVITNFVNDGKKRFVIIPQKSDVSSKKHPLHQRIAFQKQYLAKHDHSWCGPMVDHVTPRGAPWLPMWTAEYEGQRHQVNSSNLHLHSCRGKTDVNTVNKIAGLCFDDSPTSSETTSSSSSPLSLNLEVVSTSPKIFLIRNFLSSEEADKIVSIATPNLRQSEIGSTSAGAKTHRQDDIRKSSTAWLPWSQSPAFLKHIYYRAADVLKIPREYFDSNAIVEDLQVVRYRAGEMYNGHYDWGDFGHNQTRFITLLMYLNDPEEGGETAFLNAPQPDEMPTIAKGDHDKDKLGFKLHPGKGSALLFYNLLEDGNGDEQTFHASLPVTKGVKWLSNLWIWDPFFQEMQYKMLRLLIEQQMQQRLTGNTGSMSATGIEELIDFGNEYDDEL